MSFWTSAKDPYAERARQWREQEEKASNDRDRRRARSQAEEFEQLSRQLQEGD